MLLPLRREIWFVTEVTTLESTNPNEGAKGEISYPNPFIMVRLTE